jgi:hypothetical protein
MRRLHLFVGLTALAAFLITGQYMDRVHGHLVGMPDVQRLIYRSSHIYLLFAALLNLTLGTYFVPVRAGWRRLLQLSASVALLLLPALFMAAFYTEALRVDMVRPWSRPALYLGLGAVLAQLVAYGVPRRQA